MSMSVHLEMWRRFLTNPVRTLVISSLSVLACLILSVSSGSPPPNYPKDVPLVDRLIMIFGPTFSAKADIKEPTATITLKFYRVWDEAENDGRYLTVSTPRGEITRAIHGFKWFYHSRTEIYLTEDRKVAVLQPNYCCYLVSLDPLKMTEAHNLLSAGSTYLGAFDLVQYSNHSDKFELRFAPASEAQEKRN
jgi:hypothetical protein